MKLNELELDDPFFDENEDLALKELPRTKEGLNELLDYLRGIDSNRGWEVLLEDYEPLLDQEEYARLTHRAEELFGED